MNHVLCLLGYSKWLPVDEHHIVCARCEVVRGWFYPHPEKQGMLTTGTIGPELDEKVNRILGKK